MKPYNSILELIGSTPIVRINNTAPKEGAVLYAKLESFNPGGSVKDRISLAMINAAEKAGELSPDSLIIEPTSGNTGVGLALAAAAKGYKLVLTMPESMSIERRKLLAAYGAKIVLTPAAKGMPGAIRAAERLMEDTPNGFMPNQFKNPANPQIHRKTTALEILDQFNRDLNCFVCGVGTGGSITGVGAVLKDKIPGIEIIAVEPVESPVLSGGCPGKHKLQGIGAGFIPDILDMKFVDNVMQVSYEDSVQTARNLAAMDGILVGISSGAAAFAAIKVAEGLSPSKNVLVMLPDTGERYLSTELFPEPVV